MRHDSENMNAPHTLRELGVQPATVTYTNWRGETAVRRIVPLRVWFGSTAWHPEPQWLLTALDVDKGEERDFALAGFSQPITVQDAPLYQGPIVAGMEFVWEPNNSRARENIIVTKVVARPGDEAMIFSRRAGPKGLKATEVWNDESRFREAVVPAVTVQDAARVPEIAALIKKASSDAHEVFNGSPAECGEAIDYFREHVLAALRAIAEGRA